jgi:hypothetical protein
MHECLSLLNAPRSRSNVPTAKDTILRGFDPKIAAYSCRCNGFSVSRDGRLGPWLLGFAPRWCRLQPVTFIIDSYNTSLPTTQLTTVTTPLPPHMEVRQAGKRIRFLCCEQLLEPRSDTRFTVRRGDLFLFALF